ncbi:hypothetical protein NQL31_002363 [Lotmaria passim]
MDRELGFSSRMWSCLHRLLLVLPLPWSLVLMVFFFSVAAAMRFDPIQPAPSMLSIEAWSASVRAIKALELAIDDEEVRQQVRVALESVSAGFLPCLHNVYRCDDENDPNSVAEVVIDGLRGGRLNWAQFPATTRRILVRDSALQQALVLTELPQQLEVFSAVNTQWEPQSLLVHRFDVLRENGVPVMPCGRVGSPGCLFHLQKLQCVKCELTTALLTEAAPLFPNLSILDLNQNSRLTLDVRTVPPSVVALQLSHVHLGEVTAADVLQRMPRQVTQLNLSYTGIKFEWGMLREVSTNVTVLDLSGLSPPTTVADKDHNGNNGCSNGNCTVDQQRPLLTRLCDSHMGTSPVELYFSHGGITGGLPDCKECFRLETLDMSHNKLSNLTLDRLPEQLRVLRLNNNAFANGLNTSQLPRALFSLDLSFNQMTGGISIGDLPRNLEYFDISNNFFNGTVNLTELPESTKLAYLQHNNFIGEANLVDIPLGIRFIIIHHNNWDYRLPAP